MSYDHIKLTTKSGLKVEVRKTKHNMFEVWAEVDQDGRGENTFELSATYSTEEEAIKAAKYQVETQDELN